MDKSEDPATAVTELDPAALDTNHLDGDELGNEQRESKQNRGSHDQEEAP